LGTSSLGNFIPWELHPLGTSTLGQFIPWELHSLGTSFFGNFILLKLHPFRRIGFELDKESEKPMRHLPYLGKDFVTHLQLFSLTMRSRIVG